MIQQLLRFTLFSQCIFLCFACSAKKASQDTVKTAYIHKYGVEVPDQADFSNRGGTGEVVKNLKNGVVVRETYLEGKLQGVTTQTFPHSQIVERQACFQDGQLVEETFHYVTGVPKQKNCYHENKLCQSFHWYEDSAPHAVEAFKEGYLIEAKYYTLNQELESQVTNGSGVRMVRNGLGELVAKEILQLGALVEKISYHPNGSPLAVTPYVNGKIQGMKKIFHPGGEPKRVEEWKEGALDGFAFEYLNGERQAQIPYKKGVKEGVELRFKEGSNVVVEEISWVANRKQGPSVTFVEEEKVVEWYFAGEKVSKTQYVEKNSPSYLTKD